MWDNENAKYIVITQWEDYRQTEPKRTFEISQSMPVISENNSMAKTPREKQLLDCNINLKFNKPVVTDDLSAISAFSTRRCSAAIHRPAFL